MKKHPDSEPNITRVDLPNQNCWYVRVYRNEDGVKVSHNKTFSDGKYGGKEEALKAARDYLERLKALLPPPRRGRHSKQSRGYGYVRRTERAGYPVWSVWARDPNGRPTGTNYGVKRWGERGAQALAEHWLAEKLKEWAQK